MGSNSEMDSNTEKGSGIRSTQSPNVLIGCSGWSYPEWNGIVYPKDFPQAQMFKYYQTIFHTVEINSSFYQLPAEKTVGSWMKASDPNFLFSAKIPKLITHEGKLDLSNTEKVERSLHLFIHNMAPLIQNNQMLAFLLQLPPSFRYQNDYSKLEKFLSFWNENILQYFISPQKEPLYVEPQLVVEFRDLSWMRDETFGLLDHYHTSYCAVVEPLLPPRIDVTNDSLFYIRFHGFGKNPWFNYSFSNAELDDWSLKLNPLLNEYRKDREVRKERPNGDTKRAVLYFNNHFSGNAVKNAIYLANKLHIPVKKNTNDLTILEKTDKISFSGNVKNQKKIDEFYK